jgi:transposase
MGMKAGLLVFVRQTEECHMEQQIVRKTYQYKLRPTPEQERKLKRVLPLCRHVYIAAIAERRETWRMRGVSITSYQQKAELPGIKETMPEYAGVNAQVVQDVVLRVDRAFQAFFQRLREELTPGYPPFHDRDRYTSFTSPQSDASRRAGRAPLRERPRRSRSVGKRTGGRSVSPARMYPVSCYLRRGKK